MSRRLGWLHFRVTPTEEQSIRKAAQACNLSVSSYLRSLSSRKVSDPQRLKLQFRQLTQALFDAEQDIENADFSQLFALVHGLEQEVCP